MKHIIRNSFLWLASWALTLLFYLPATAQNCNFTITVPDDITLCNEGFVNLNGR
ncbi:MAG: hypothetical protein IPH36_16015 [Saprospiraceae bacterium]|nr:hypothetical protein [Saprospiraceae bacterium]